MPQIEDPAESEAWEQGKSQNDPIEQCCGHAYSRHLDLVGCAVDGCDCAESKATIIVARYNSDPCTDKWQPSHIAGARPDGCATCSADQRHAGFEQADAEGAHDDSCGCYNCRPRSVRGLREHTP